MEIREYKQKDEIPIISLWEICGLLKPWNNPQSDIARKLKVDPDLFLVGQLDRKIIASVMGGYEGHRGWINYLAVDPGYQHKGFAKQIMKEIEIRIRAKGAPKINLQIRTSNKHVIKFYESIGYKIDGVVSMGKKLMDDEPFDKCK